MTARTGSTVLGAEIEQHRRALRANPRNARAHAMLGLALLEQRNLAEAVVSLRRALALDPSLTDLHSMMAAALHVLGEREAAAESYRRAISAQPKDAELHRALSHVLRELGQLEAALASARKAAQLKPADAQAHLVLAAAHHALGEHEDATACFDRALEIAPEDIDARYDGARTLLQLRQHERAATAFRELLERKPDHADACHGLATCLIELQQYDEAVSLCQRAVEVVPDHLMALRDMGVALHRLGRSAEGREALERALEHHPNDAQTLTSLLMLVMAIGDVNEALAYGRRALEAAPDSPAVYSNLLFVLSHCCSDPVELTAEHFRYGDRWEGPYRGRWAPHPNQRDPERRLQIGIVSADLYNHAVAHFVEPILDVLQHSTQLTLHAYYNGRVEDVVTERMRGYVAHWHSIADLDDDAAERQIRADGIDILIDLSGHSSDNRLALFARKPAPVQASWIGYAGTTGLQAMDYYLGDQFHLPEGRYDDQFTEKIVRLPIGAAFNPEPNAPPVNELPALRNGYLTFGSFHRINKLSREVIALWAQLLRGVPNSKMLLGGLSKGGDMVVLNWFDEEGIDRSRLILRERTHMYGYLEQHHEVDICLSPFPYTGSTTLFHALWMGVPTLATVGPTNPSHAIACGLVHLGLSSFIANDAESYVQLGKFLSENTEVLAKLRATMRERFTSSLLGYPGIVAAGLEHGLRLMWQRWCANLPAAPLRVRLSDLVPAEETAAS